MCLGWVVLLFFLLFPPPPPPPPPPSPSYTASNTTLCGPECGCAYIDAVGFRVVARNVQQGAAKT